MAKSYGKNNNKSNEINTDDLTNARDNFKNDKSHWSKPYQVAKEDLFFLSDDPMAQWEAVDYRSRTESARPALTIDMLSQFIHQTVNDIRMNTPSINVIPGGNEATQETAEVYKGLIRNIEYASAADDAYDNAVNYSVKCSIGFIRVDHDYVDDSSFEQELMIKRVVNPLAVYIDGASIEPDGRDAKRATIIEQMSVAAFKAKYPGKEVSCFEDSNERLGDYSDDEKVSIAEQFTIVEEDSMIAIDHDGNPVDYDEGADQESYANTRKIKKKKVLRRLWSGKELLEETIFPGKYIPIVPVYGEEAWHDGKRSIFSLIRKSKGAQQMYNYWKSLETELLMKQPNAPVMARAGQVEDYAEDWQNPQKSMVLRYKGEDENGNPLPPPERLAPPTVPTGIVNASRETIDDIKATMGLYNAALGARSNETSGVAINQRKLEGDVATYHFGDNLMKSITQVGRILVCAIPEIYDTQRVLRIIDEEDEPSQVGINGAMAEEQEETFDLSQGKYDVKVIAGTTFTTRRQETVQAMTELFRGAPDLMSIMGDIYFKNSDFTGAEAMAERMKKAMDPKFVEEEGEVDPEMQAIHAEYEQAIQMLQGELAVVQKELGDKRAEIEVKMVGEQNKATAAQANNELKAMELRIKEMGLQIDEAKLSADIELKARELQLREAESAEKLRIEEEKVRGKILNDKGNLQLDEQELAAEILTSQQKLALEEEALLQQQLVEELDVVSNTLDSVSVLDQDDGEL